MQEEFKPVVGYEGLYEVSNLGNIKSLKFNKEKILKPQIRTGYWSVGLYLDNKFKSIKIHKLVAAAFLNHITDGSQRMVVDHINNIKTDNRLVNLQIITQRENSSKDKISNTGYTGIYKRNNKYRVVYRTGKIQYHIGYFFNLNEAIEARKQKINQISNQ